MKAAEGVTTKTIKRRFLNGKPIFVFCGNLNRPTLDLDYPIEEVFSKAEGFVRTTWDGAVDSVWPKTKVEYLTPDWVEPIDKGCIGCWAYDSKGHVIFGIVLYDGEYIQKGEKPHYCVWLAEKQVGANDVVLSVPKEVWC